MPRAWMPEQDTGQCRMCVLHLAEQTKGYESRRGTAHKRGCTYPWAIVAAAIRESGRIQVMVQTLAMPPKGTWIRMAQNLFKISTFFVIFACKIALKRAILNG
jgi:hypothetical protein